jgi:hypothetical protein
MKIRLRPAAMGIGRRPDQAFEPARTTTDNLRSLHEAEECLPCVPSTSVTVSLRHVVAHAELVFQT